MRIHGSVSFEPGLMLVPAPAGALRAAPVQALALQASELVTDSAVEREADLELRFEALLATHRERAVRVAWRILGGDQAAAEDVAQEAFISAYQALGRFRGSARLETWFYRILVRKAYSHIRWRKVRERFGRVDPETAPEPNPAAPGDPALRRRIAEALDSLPRTQREAFVLVHLEGFTVREAAEIMGKADGTVKSHLHRALTKLRELLADAFADTGAATDDT